VRTVLVTGGNGQLGWELQRHAPDSWSLRALPHAALDITDAGQIAAALDGLRPDWVVNTAAYTAVDRAESEPRQAQAINVEGPARLAEACAARGIALVHLSTDFVFDGRQSRPYRPDDPPNPLSVYGRTKLAGEQAVRERLGDDALIVRTSWAYSVHGHNFVKTMLRCLAERPQVDVVCDQVGTPTWAAGLARALIRAIERDVRGIGHWTDNGVASWYDFAVAIRELALQLGLLREAAPVAPIATADYPTPARRPAYSVLDKRDFQAALDLPGVHWRESLHSMMQELCHG